MFHAIYMCFVKLLFAVYNVAGQLFQWKGGKQRVCFFIIYLISDNDEKRALTGRLTVSCYVRVFYFMTTFQ